MALLLRIISNNECVYYIKKVYKRPSYILLLLSLSQIEKFYDIVIDELLSKEKM